MSEIGIIGGSGVYNIDGIKIVREHEINTPFGYPSDKIMEGRFQDYSFYFLPRHGKDHRYLPSEINYRANIYALKKLGVSYLISVSAVGSLDEDCPPKTFVFPDQFIDWTKGRRERSYFGDGVIGHVSVAYPVEKKLQEVLLAACCEINAPCSAGGAYICIEGPQFSTRAESEFYRQMGARVIGMTNVPEAYLAKEAGMAYATIAMVTDFDCWKEEHCTVEEIMKIMKYNNSTVQELLKIALPCIAKNKFSFKRENEIGIMTPTENLSDKQKEIVNILIS